MSPRVHITRVSAAIPGGNFGRAPAYRCAHAGYNSCFLRLRRQLRKHDLMFAAATIQHDGQIKKSLSIPSHKNIPLAPSGKSVIKSARLTRQEGRAHVTNARWDAVDAECARRTRRKRTAKSCGPDVAVLASSFTNNIVERRRQKSRSPGRARSKP